MVILVKISNNIEKNQRTSREAVSYTHLDVYKRQPLIYYARESWFIKMTAVKEHLIGNNNTINWIPESIGKGRFGDWLENIQDWGLSRNKMCIRDRGNLAALCLQAVDQVFIQIVGGGDDGVREACLIQHLPCFLGKIRQVAAVQADSVEGQRNARLTHCLLYTS